MVVWERGVLIWLIIQLGIVVWDGGVLIWLILQFGMVVSERCFNLTYITIWNCYLRYRCSNLNHITIRNSGLRWRCFNLTYIKNRNGGLRWRCFNLTCQNPLIQASPKKSKLQKTNTELLTTHKNAKIITLSNWNFIFLCCWQVLMSSNMDFFKRTFLDKSV